jgi:hypothetical protein
MLLGAPLIGAGRANHVLWKFCLLPPLHLFMESATIAGDEQHEKLTVWS